MRPLLLLAALLANPRDLAPVPLPGPAGALGFDDLVCAPELRRVIVPARATGRIDLVDPATGAVESVQAFRATASEGIGHAHGVTSADAGPEALFAIDRTARIVAAVDVGSKRVVARAGLSGGPDCVRWVGETGEVWVTEPGRRSIEIFRFAPGPRPSLTRTGAIPSAPDGHCAAADDLGNAWVCDPRGGRLLLLRDPYPESR